VADAFPGFNGFLRPVLGKASLIRIVDFAGADAAEAE